MPPSQKGGLFKREDITKAFFDLDLSSSEPSIPSPTSTPHRNHPVIIPATSNAETNNKVTFLTLPLEIRLRIYDLLLVSRFDRAQNPSWAVGNTYQQLIILHMIRIFRHGTMEPGILRTCKQIHHEAHAILYSQNVFKITEPKDMFRFSAEIGIANIKLLRTLYIWVPYTAKLTPWLQILHFLAEEATGLRFIELGWGASCEFPWQLERGARERGLGDNLEFVRALGKIQGLKRLVITGYFAKNWPAYLERRMSVPVRSVPADFREEGYLSPEVLALKNKDWLCEHNQEQLEAFEKYQQGTEDLIP